MCTQSEAVQIFREAYLACSKALNGKVTNGYLYGSYARGDFHEDSDIDILLTVDMTAEELMKYRHAVSVINSDLSMEHDVTVSVTVKPLEQFTRYADTLPYYKNVLKEGIAYAV